MVPRNLETPTRARRDEAESSFGAIDRGVDRDVVPDEICHFDGDLRVGRVPSHRGLGLIVAQPAHTSTDTRNSVPRATIPFFGVSMTESSLLPTASRGSSPLDEEYRRVEEGFLEG